jgi:SAM-dependent methyltransferase
MMRLHRGNRDLAFADAVGAPSLELFVEQGDGQVAVLRHHGLEDGMAIYDVGCGCGRTAQALQRAGWQGSYIGADVVPDFIAEMTRKCPGAEGHVQAKPKLMADSGSLDMVFHWSVFTHISPEDCYLYLEDTFRALKPGGKLIFSFLDLTEPQHYSVFAGRCERLRDGKDLPLVDTFLHRTGSKSGRGRRALRSPVSLTASTRPTIRQCGRRSFPWRSRWTLAELPHVRIQGSLEAKSPSLFT